MDGQHGVIIRWLAELNAEDKGTNLESAVSELNQMAIQRKHQIRSDSLLVDRFIFLIEEAQLPKVKDYPELKAGFKNS